MLDQIKDPVSKAGSALKDRYLSGTVLAAGLLIMSIFAWFPEAVILLLQLTAMVAFVIPPAVSLAFSIIEEYKDTGGVSLVRTYPPPEKE